MDRMIIKAYDKEGSIHKILRIKIDDDMNVTATPYQVQIFNMESWQDTIQRRKEELLELEQDSLMLIKDSIKQHPLKTPTILTSGGKDSNLTTYLVRLVHPDTEAIFNNTSLDCADTYKYIKEQPNTKILSPKEGFYQWRQRNNFIPTRFARGCCSLFKEAETVNQLGKDEHRLFFMGMRNAESNHRSGYGDEWKNDKWGSREWLGILPIRKWTEEDVWLYTIWKGIHINSKYKKGYARVGCSVCCPYYTKSTWALDKYWYPKAYTRWQDILRDDFINNNKWTVMNCTIEEYSICWNGGTYRKEPTHEVIEEFAEYNGLEFDVAARYFNHDCEECKKRIKSKEVLAMNMKYLGRNASNFFCKKHLQEHLTSLSGEKFTNDKWNEAVESFKSSGCELF